MVNEVGNFFVKADNVCDYIPAVSTLSNLTDLFQKCVVLPFVSTQSITNSHYYTHLKNKSILRCIILLIPVVGNIIVGIYDFANRKYNDRDFMLAAVKQDGLALEDANEQFKDDREVVLAAVQQNGWALEDASEQFKEDRDFMLAAVQRNGLALRFASEQLKDDREVVLAAVQQNGLVLRDASEQLKGDREVVLAAVQQNGWVLSDMAWYLGIPTNSSKTTG
jgi:Domain of unknown function (DUF4116)